LFYTAFAAGIALFFLVPTLFIASFAASCFFLWGLVVYLILQRFNEGEAPGKPGTRVGDKLHGLTGGRLGWMVEGEDGTPVQMGQTQDSTRTNGSRGHERGRATSGQEGNGLVKETEWDSKWTMGMRPQKELLRDNLEVKVDTVVSLPALRPNVELTPCRRFSRLPRLPCFLELFTINAMELRHTTYPNESFFRNTSIFDADQPLPKLRKFSGDVFSPLRLSELIQSGSYDPRLVQTTSQPLRMECMFVGLGEE
jgi:hypothetical protein